MISFALSSHRPPIRRSGWRWGGLVNCGAGVSPARVQIVSLSGTREAGFRLRPIDVVRTSVHTSRRAWTKVHATECETVSGQAGRLHHNKKQARGRRLRSISIAALAIILLAGGSTGCEKPEEIRVYTVAKPPPLDPKLSGGFPSSAKEQDERIPDRDFSQGRPAGGSTVNGPAEILGAITPRGKMTWFFKLTGAPAAVADVKKEFAVFINSVKFQDEKPEWDLPEGWKSESGSEMRFATIRIATAAGPLEMSVIPLESGPGKFEPYLLANVNRWRQQVGLAPLSEAQLADSKEIIKIELNGAPVWFADFIGESQGTGMGGPVAGPVAKRGASPSREASPAKGAGKLPFDCRVPAGWTSGRAGQFQLAAFDVRDGDREAAVTVSTAGGDRTANINRWRGQVGLADASATEIDQQAKTISVDGHEATYIELVGPESASPRKTILGVIVTVEGKQWFIKLTGDAELAAREKDRFEEFVKSIKFKP